MLYFQMKVKNILLDFAFSLRRIWNTTTRGC